ncbi:MAG TPA: potassium transporter TrkG, partial [Sideroxyarcus sp.]|nr:potassium transporter TrkG [Sideroxyarcus sp.]
MGRALTVLNALGLMLVVFSISYVLPVLTSLIYHDETLAEFLVAMWTAMPAVATFPLLLVIHGLSFTDAYFETMSGITTTGATVLTGLDNLPPAINLWRHELNWLGGMGIIVLAVAILPMLGVGGMQLYRAETPGPMKDSKLTPRIT